MGEQTCIHCGARIVLTNYVLGPEWDHEPAGSTNRSRYCRTTVATPPEAPEEQR